MSDASDSPSPLTVVPVEPERKGQALLAWLVIAGLVGLIIRLQMIRPAKEEAADSGHRAIWFVKMQGRYLVGAADLFGNREKFYPQTTALNTGPIDQRLIFVIVSGELGEPKRALENLQDLHDRIKKNNVQ